MKNSTSAIVLLSVLGLGLLLLVLIPPHSNGNDTVSSNPLRPGEMSELSLSLENKIKALEAKSWYKLGYEELKSTIDESKAQRRLTPREADYLNEALELAYLNTLKAAAEANFCPVGGQEGPGRDLYAVYEELKRYQAQAGSSYQEATKSWYDACRDYYRFREFQRIGDKAREASAYDRAPFLSYLTEVDRLRKQQSSKVANCPTIQQQVRAHRESILTHMVEQEEKKLRPDLEKYYGSELYDQTKTQALQARLQEVLAQPFLKEASKLRSFYQEMTQTLDKHREFDQRVKMAYSQKPESCEQFCGDFKGYVPVCDSLKNL